MSIPTSRNSFPDPTELFRLSTAYWESAALFAAIDCGLFAHLRCGPATAAQLAKSMNWSCRGVTALCEALASLGLLERTGDDYRLSEVSSAYLTPESPAYFGKAILWSRDQYAAWGDLPRAVAAGEPVREMALHLGEDEERTRRFVEGMDERAAGPARAIVGALDLTGRTRLLDLGGGSGGYSRLLVARYPDLHATVVEVPGIARIAREMIDAAGFAERITVRDGDVLSGLFGKSEYDCVLISGVLHQMSGEAIQTILAGVRLALIPGGVLYVADIMSGNPQSHRFAAHFGLQMLLTTPAGGVFSAEDCSVWLHEAGFEVRSAHHLPPPLPYTVICAS